MILLDNTRMDLLEFDKEFTKFDYWKLTSQPEPVEVGKLEVSKRFTTTNDDGLESAKPDLQSVFKKPDGAMAEP
jgi:hypothetical protein